MPAYHVKKSLSREIPRPTPRGGVWVTRLSPWPKNFRVISPMVVGRVVTLVFQKQRCVKNDHFFLLTKPSSIIADVTKIDHKNTEILNMCQSQKCIFDILNISLYSPKMSSKYTKLVSPAPYKRKT